MLTLLLNNSYECMSFIPERRMLKLIAKDKVEVVSVWEGIIRWGSGSMDHPAIVRLTYYVPPRPKKKRFCRGGVFKRDRNMCQYCGVIQSPAKLTIDHVMPRALGGKNSWENCVASCLECNNKKRDRTPKQAGMKLLKGKKPKAPFATMLNEYKLINNKHDSWSDYVLY